MLQRQLYISCCGIDIHVDAIEIDCIATMRQNKLYLLVSTEFVAFQLFIVEF
jgi:hypothetical protein